MNTPTRLRAEHLDHAFGITNPQPRLSWRPPAGCHEQRAYQVQWGRWDSGRVESSQNVLVDVSAPPLRSRERRTWRVRVWTERGITDWSEDAVVEAGLLHPQDWTATWIRPTESDVPVPGHRPAYLLRRPFVVHGPITSARAYVTAQGLYELFVNDQRVGDAELTPGFTDYRTTLHVQTYDISSMLVRGDNTLAVVLSDGWFRGINGMFRDANCFGDRTALLAQLHLDVEDGSQVVVGTDSSWRSTTGALTRADLMEGVVADLRLEPSGWAKPGFDDSSWNLVEEASIWFDHLVSSPAPPVVRTELRRPLSVHTAPSGAQVVDMGENIVGWARLSELGPDGTQTRLLYAEALSPDGEASHENLLPDHMPPGEPMPSVGQVDVVISAGRPEEVFEPRHSTKGYRYLEITGATRTLTPEDITGVVVHTDLNRTGTFSCSSELLNQLHEVAVRSFLGNAVDIPTDCPTRERTGWTGDWAAFVPSAAFLFDVAGFSQKWLRDLAAQQFDDGVVPNWIPDHFGPGIRQHPFLATNLGSAGWGDAAVIVPWEIYRAYGDTGLLERQWPSMVAVMERAIRMARQGRHPARAAARPDPLPHEEYLWDTGFHFGEWLEPGVQIGWEELQAADQAVVATAYLRLSSDLLSKIATIRGDESAADRYRKVSEGARAAWQAEFVSASGAITPDTQATLVRALAFDLLDPDQRSAAVERLVTLIREAGTHLGTGFLATPYLLPVLSDHGHLDLAYELLFQTSPPSWLHMLEHGATTVWELWDAIDPDGAAHESLNHYSKGAVIGFLHRYVAGLRCLDSGPGYRRFRVEPRPGAGLTWAEVTHESPYGPIEVAWQQRGDIYRLRVAVPAGTCAEVVLPNGQHAVANPGTAVFEWPCQPPPGDTGQRRK